MLVENQIIKMKWSGSNVNHYLAKGYIFTKFGDMFDVRVKDLSDSSHVLVQVKCDYCGKIQDIQYSVYFKHHSDIFGDACKACAYKKQQATMLYRYGEKNPSLIKDFQEKRKETFVARFGCENPSQNKSVQEKRMNTFIKKYGETSPMKNKAVQEKTKQTCMERYGKEYSTQTNSMKVKSKQTCLKKYGVDNASKAKSVKEKIETVCLEKYGVKNIMELEYFRNKILESFVKNGTAPTSSLQIKVSNTVKEIYGTDKVKDNVPCGSCLLDIELSYNSYKIDIEYDGYYWHKNRTVQDRKRDEYIKSKGYKILRIRSNKELPTKEQIIEKIDYLVKDNHSFSCLDLDI